MRPRTVPLVLPPCRVKKSIWKEGKTNLSHDGLNPAHVPLLQVNNLTLSAFCNGMMRRADIEGSKSYVALDAWQPQASYPCGNFSGTSGRRFSAKTQRIDRTQFPRLFSHWKTKSSGLLPFSSTWDFSSHWARLGSPALFFRRCTAPVKLPTCFCWVIGW